ncbi:RNase adapter RapZ [Streptosporangium sp. NPDC051022]|uniref:RapZ C-terminal domain-containing protein n=1 Tax=Streptosporangium sp. NPDC051022 TaxID=3155752 RepID=UPI00342F1819
MRLPVLSKRRTAQGDLRHPRKGHQNHVEVDHWTKHRTRAQPPLCVGERALHGRPPPGVQGHWLWLHRPFLPPPPGRGPAMIDLDLAARPQPRIRIISFGYGHGEAPVADLTVDGRRHYRNPHHDPAMRDLTGLDDAVRRHVMTTPGVRDAVAAAVWFARRLLDEVLTAHGGAVVVAFGCVGGRHRSVAMAQAAAALLREAGVPAEVEHRDVTKPVIQR